MGVRSFTVLPYPCLYFFSLHACLSVLFPSSNHQHWLLLEPSKRGKKIPMYTANLTYLKFTIILWGVKTKRLWKWIWYPLFSIDLLIMKCLGFHPTYCLKMRRILPSVTGLWYIVGFFESYLMFYSTIYASTISNVCTHIHFASIYCMF